MKGMVIYMSTTIKSAIKNYLKSMSALEVLQAMDEQDESKRIYNAIPGMTEEKLDTFMKSNIDVFNKFEEKLDAAFAGITKPTEELLESAKVLWLEMLDECNDMEI
jgi:hypothetical protein